MKVLAAVLAACLVMSVYSQKSKTTTSRGSAQALPVLFSANAGNAPSGGAVGYAGSNSASAGSAGNGGATTYNGFRGNNLMRFLALTQLGDNFAQMYRCQMMFSPIICLMSL